MNAPTPFPSRRLRRLVLGGAVAAALALAALLPAPPASLDGVADPALEVLGTAHAADAPKAPAPPAAPALPSPPAPPDASGEAADTPPPPGGIDINIDEKGIRIDPAGKGGSHRAGVVVKGLGHDQSFESVDQFARKEPWVATMVFGIVAVVFLAPVLLIGLVLAYKMRRQRMVNETMLKLAEKGALPATALEALQSGRMPDALPGAAAAAGEPLARTAAAPSYAQAQVATKRAAWSDLRKGVVLGAVGLGLTFFSILDDQTPNSVGLVLLFLGIGYAILWYFEDRHLRANRPDPTQPPGGA